MNWNISREMHTIKLNPSEFTKSCTLRVQNLASISLLWLITILPRGTHLGNSLTLRENNALLSSTTQKTKTKKTKTSSPQEEGGGASPKPKEIKRREREVFNLLRRTLTKVQP